MEEDLRVAGAGERVFASKFGPERDEILVIAIGDEHHCVSGRTHRLAAGLGKIQDAEPTVPQVHVRVLPLPPRDGTRCASVKRASREQSSRAGSNAVWPKIPHIGGVNSPAAAYSLRGPSRQGRPRWCAAM